MSSLEPKYRPDESTCDSDPLKIEEADVTPESPHAEPTSAVVFVQERSRSSCSSNSQSDGTASSTDVELQVPASVKVRDKSLTIMDSSTIPPTSDGVKPIDNWPILEILPGCVINNTFCEDDNFAKLVDIDMTEKPQIDIPTYLRLASHADVKMWSCAVCDESFNHMKELTEHVRFHKRDRKRKAVIVKINKKKPKEKQSPGKLSKKSKSEAKEARD